MGAAHVALWANLMREIGIPQVKSRVYFIPKNFGDMVRLAKLNLESCGSSTKAYTDEELWQLVMKATYESIPPFRPSFDRETLLSSILSSL